MRKVIDFFVETLRICYSVSSSFHSRVNIVNMLSRKEHWLNLRSLKLLSKINVLPVYIDTNKFIAEPRNRGKLLWMWIIVPIMVQFHVFYAVGRFLLSLRTIGVSAIATATVDYAVIMFGELGVYAVLESFVRNPAVTKLMCKNLILPEVDSIICDLGTGVFWGYSLTEVCTMVFPIGVFPAVAIVSFMYGTLYLWTETSGCDSQKCIMSFLAEVGVNFCWMSFCYCIGLLQIVFLQTISHD